MPDHSNTKAAPTARLSTGYLVLTCLVIVTFEALPVPRLMTDLMYSLVSLSVCAAIVVAIRRYRPRAAAAWYLMAAGQALWVVADSLFSYLEDVAAPGAVPERRRRVLPGRLPAVRDQSGDARARPQRRAPRPRTAARQRHRDRRPVPALVDGDRPTHHRQPAQLPGLGSRRGGVPGHGHLADRRPGPAGEHAGRSLDGVPATSSPR